MPTPKEFQYAYEKGFSTGYWNNSLDLSYVYGTELAWDLGLIHGEQQKKEHKMTFLIHNYKKDRDNIVYSPIWPSPEKIINLLTKANILKE